MDYRKDKKPSETISNILSILKKYKIPINWTFYHFTNLFYSCRVFIKDYPLIGTNGKGINKELALASGLAEFMERLQSFSIIKPSYCSSKLKVNGIITERKNLSDIYMQDKKYLDEDIFHNNYNECIAYKNIVNGNIAYIPYLYINSTCGTNGLCAGNTYSEAISQGICEILERYCVQQYLLKKTILNTIDLDELQREKIFDEIKKLKKFGLKILIKDLSFGIYPVVGVVIFDSSNNYIFAAGCDVDINIAIQRCLTEIFQGLTNRNYHSKFHKFSNSINTIDNFHKMVRNNNADLDNTILLGEKVTPKDLPFCRVANNKQSLNYLIKIITQKNNKIFLKDYSILGFNTYHIYIPGMSEIYEFNSSFIKNKIFLKNAMFNSDNLNKRYMNKFKKVIDATKFKRCGSFFNLDLMFNSNINNINSEGLFLIINDKYNHKNNNKLYKNFKLPASLNDCKNCDLKKKCYYKKWEKYFNILTNATKLGIYNIYN